MAAVARISVIRGDQPRGLKMPLNGHRCGSEYPDHAPRRTALVRRLRVSQSDIADRSHPQSAPDLHPQCMWANSPFAIAK
jgi:hypothetical protein